jgi:hypothetical protein
MGQGVMKQISALITSLGIIPRNSEGCTKQYDRIVLRETKPPSLFTKSLLFCTAIINFFVHIPSEDVLILNFKPYFYRVAAL